jgi:hypothetical protein
MAIGRELGGQRPLGRNISAWDRNIKMDPKIYGMVRRCDCPMSKTSGWLL